MSELVRLTSEKELRAIHGEALINNSTKVNKVSDNSVLSGIIAGNAKTAKKALKDLALSVSHRFPNTATGSNLDATADVFGIAPRLGASQSSTYIRLVAQVGTSYQQGVNTVSTNSGIVFDLEEDITIGSFGYGYVKVRSQESGAFTNVDAFTIVNVSPIPGGHIGVLNEYRTVGGRDVEQDDVFRQRIKEGSNILARGTIDYLTQVFIRTNPNVLRIVYQGVNPNGKISLSILTQNGINLTQVELDQLLQQGSSFFSLTELSPIGTNSFGIELQNVTYQPIDVAFRFELFDQSLFADTVRRIQIAFSKLVDYRFWDAGRNRVEFEELLEIVGNTENVKYVPDRFFLPRADVIIDRGKFPRFRGFEIRDLDGNIILNQSGTIQPVFFPNEVNTNFVLTVL